MCRHHGKSNRENRENALFRTLVHRVERSRNLFFKFMAESVITYYCPEGHELPFFKRLARV